MGIAQKKSVISSTGLQGHTKSVNDGMKANGNLIFV